MPKAYRHNSLDDHIQRDTPSPHLLPLAAMACHSIAGSYPVLLAGYRPSQDREVAVPFLAILLSWKQLIKEEMIIVGAVIIRGKMVMPFQHIPLTSTELTFGR